MQKIEGLRVGAATTVRWLDDDGSVFFEGTEAELISYLDFVQTVPSAAAVIPLVPPDQFETVWAIVDRTRSQQGVEPDDEALERIARLLAH